MRGKHFIGVVALMIAAVPANANAPQSIGIYGRWGAFADAAGERCHAIAEPTRSSAGGKQRGFALVAIERARPAYGVVVRLSRGTAPESRIILAVGDARFPLAGSGALARAPDARAAIAIVGAIRRGNAMSISATDTRASPFVDTYALRGAASAIDAAAVRCRPR